MILLLIAAASLLSGQGNFWAQDDSSERVSVQDQRLRGDMILSKDLLQRGIKDERFRWPGYPGAARIPYEIDPSASRLRMHISAAIRQYNDNTCVKFVPRTTERDYIRFNFGDECSAYVGYVRDEPMPLALNLNSSCSVVPFIVHELGHVIGFMHEEQRSDRDQYLIIHLENVAKENHQLFKINEPKFDLILNSFDYESIMLNGDYYFSKNGQKTMEAKRNQLIKDTANKYGLNRSDIERVKKLYKCY